MMKSTKHNSSSGRSQGTSSVSLDRGRGIVSFHKMKSLFCDDCIQDILDTVEDELVDEAVLYDTEEKKFYPVTEGNLQIGDYAFDLFYEAGSFQIDITSANKRIPLLGTHIPRSGIFMRHNRKIISPRFSSQTDPPSTLNPVNAPHRLPKHNTCFLVLSDKSK